MATYPHPAKGSRHPANTHHRSGVRKMLHGQRQTEAASRWAAYRALTTAQKIASLGKRDAVKQRARLRAEMKAREEIER